MNVSEEESKITLPSASLLIDIGPCIKSIVLIRCNVFKSMIDTISVPYGKPTIATYNYH